MWLKVASKYNKRVQRRVRRGQKRLQKKVLEALTGPDLPAAGLSCRCDEINFHLRLKKNKNIVTS
jgi:hypothetical protein